MRPLARYFGGNTDVAQISQYLQAALGTGATIYMPRIPLRDDEAQALATYIASLAPPKLTAGPAVPGAKLATASTAPAAQGAAR
jgi:hypothetical protein